MGLLLSNIESPKPLTKLLKSSVPREKRAEWAIKSESYVKTLHEHDIIWGDAKADNFLVDADDDLWIIDFGGSYTEGWVDPELSETREGDDMGVEKVVEALERPDGDEVGKQREKETASGLFVTEVQGEVGGKREKREKRKRGEVDDGEDEGEESKKVKGDDDRKNENLKSDDGGDGSDNEYKDE